MNDKVKNNNEVTEITISNISEKVQVMEVQPVSGLDKSNCQKCTLTYSYFTIFVCKPSSILKYLYVFINRKISYLHSFQTQII